MNEIEAEVSGVVREILVEDAQPVEFGQVLSGSIPMADAPSAPGRASTSRGLAEMVRENGSDLLLKVGRRRPSGSMAT